MAAFLKAISDIKRENHAPVFDLIGVTKYIGVNTDSFNTAIAGEYADLKN